MALLKTQKKQGLKKKTQQKLLALGSLLLQKQQQAKKALQASGRKSATRGRAKPR